MREAIRRVAVTGAAGYVAGAFIRGLESLDQIDEVLAIDINRPLRSYSSKVAFLHQDVTSEIGGILQEHRVQAVVHLAYVLNPGHDRSSIRRVNVGGLVQVLAGCADADVQHIIYLSSTSVYGAHPDNPPLITENFPLRPVKGFQYSEDKVRSEELLNRFTAEHPKVTCTLLRACPVLGPTADNFIARAFSRSRPVSIRGCDPRLQFLHEDDLADIMCMCLVQRVSRVYNVAGDGSIRWSEMADIAGRELLNVPARLLYGVTELAWRLRLQNDSPACGLDFIRYPWNVATDRIKRELGVKFRYSSPEAWKSFVFGRPTHAFEGRSQT